MTVSQIDFEYVCQYLNLSISEDDDIEKTEINSYIEFTKSYLKEYLEMTMEEIDKKEYLVIPALLLIGDMYENKTMEGFKVENPTFKSFLDLARGAKI